MELTCQAPNWVSWDEENSSGDQVAGNPALEAKHSTTVQGTSGLGAGQGDAEPPQLEWRVTRFKVVRHNSEKDRLKVARTNLRSLNWSDQPIAVGRGNTQWRKGC